MKYCDICGTYNFKENNYCIYCGNKLIIENICQYCGKINGDSDSFCIECGQQIKPVAINDFDILFNQYNENLLLNYDLDDEKYHRILSDIFKRAEYSKISGISVKDKILNFANIFSECKTKSRGYERGFNLGNSIFYDDRLDDSIQIATIIHELSHYLLFEIVERVMCNIFDVKSTSTLQSFVWFFLILPDISIMNEYCAHTVEGRFIPYGYQNYASFNASVENSEIDDENLNDMIVLGNSFANELIVFLEKYIDNELRESIKLQYKKDLNEPKFDSIMFETDVALPLNIKNKFLVKKIYETFKFASNIEARKELEFIRESLDGFD